jgi:hypothetical protein
VDASTAAIIGVLQLLTASVNLLVVIVVLIAAITYQKTPR